MVTLEPVSLDALSPMELAWEMAAAIAALADIEARYERDRDGIVRWVGREAAKQRLLAHLDETRLRDREPLVRWLAEARRHTTAPPPAEAILSHAHAGPPRCRPSAAR